MVAEACAVPKPAFPASSRIQMTDDDFMPAPTEMPAPSGTATPGDISGRWVVIGLFLFGIVAVGTIWFYWKLHTAPFLPLQQAIADTFDDSRPLVEGGQRKMNQNTPPTLRIVMKIEFNPFAEAEAQQVESIIDRLHDLAREHQPDFDTYDVFEVHLWQPVPEKEFVQRKFERSLR
jgi:hypothetical protein